MVLPQFYVDDVIRTALKEDINYLDTTTDLMIPEEARTTARFMAKAEGLRTGDCPACVYPAGQHLFGPGAGKGRGYGAPG